MTLPQSVPAPALPLSLSGRYWRIAAPDPALVREIAARCGGDMILAHILAAREIAPDKVADWLKPTLRAFFPDPARFIDMDKAVDIIADALETRSSIAIFADYDVDGATSAALWTLYLRHFGLDPIIYVPERLTEGYGPSKLAFERLQAEGVDLVITVDCGATAIEAIGHGVALGLTIVVIDHHLTGGVHAPAAAIVNPNRPDCASGEGALTAVGVSLVVLAGLNREGRARGWFAHDQVEPDLKQWLDLAALGTVCDVAPLRGLNRALVAQGLKVLEARRSLGLAALASAAEITSVNSVYHLGFGLGPRINAGGRIGRSRLGAELLTTTDAQIAHGLAAELNALNAERRQIEATILAEATEAAQRQRADDAAMPVIVVGQEGWHPGVIGIVAGRLREAFNKPAIVIGWLAGEALARGSGRSTPGVNLGAAIGSLYRDGVLAAGGGHAMAAGLSILPDQIDEFRTRLAERLADDWRDNTERLFVQADLVGSLAGANASLVDRLAQLAPFGPGNPQPRFLWPSVRVVLSRIVGAGHVSVSLTDDTGARVAAIAFRAVESALGAALLDPGRPALDILGKLSRDSFRGGDQVQIDIEDLRLAALAR